MAKLGSQPSFCDDNTHSESHLSLVQAMNESEREETMKEKVSNENGEHEEAQDKVTFLLLSRDEDFVSETISRANTKYCRAFRVNSRYIP